MSIFLFIFKVSHWSVGILSDQLHTSQVSVKDDQSRLCPFKTLCVLSDLCCGVERIQKGSWSSCNLTFWLNINHVETLPSFLLQFEIVEGFDVFCFDLSILSFAWTTHWQLWETFWMFISWILYVVSSYGPVHLRTLTNKHVWKWQVRHLCNKERVKDD